MRGATERTDERALIRAAQRGDSRAFEQLVRTYDHNVLRMAFNLLHSQEDARDIYQEVFLRVYRSRSTYEPTAKFTTWLFRIATHLALNHLRDGKNEKGQESLDVEVERGADDLVALDEALQRLTAEEPTAAEVVKLRYFAGLTAEEAAAALGISLRTANRHWAYAKAWLYRHMSERDGTGT